MDYYDDRKIILDYDKIEFGPSIFIPEITGSHINITTDKQQSLWASISLTWGNNSREDVEQMQNAVLTYRPNPYISFSTSYDHYDLKRPPLSWINYCYKKVVII